MYFAESSWFLIEDVQIVAEVLRAVHSFPNVRRGPQQSGVLKRWGFHECANIVGEVLNIDML